MQKISNVQPVRHLLLLSLFTFGIYEIYWFYRTWKQLKAHRNLDIRPGWRTVGLFVPIYGIILVYGLFQNIRDFAKEAGRQHYTNPGWLTAGYIAASFLSFQLGVAEGETAEPGAVLILAVAGLAATLFGVWMLLVVQKTLNNYWMEEQQNLPTRARFSGGETALMVIGGFLWLLYIVGTVFPE